MSSLKKQQVKMNMKQIAKRDYLSVMIPAGFSKKEASQRFESGYGVRFTKQGKLRKGSRMPATSKLSKAIKLSQGEPKTDFWKTVKFNPNAKPFDPNAIKMQDAIQSNTVVSPLNILAQITSTKIDVELDVDAHSAMAACWSLYCMSNGVGVNEVVNVPGTGLVGVLYFMAVTIAYDLWCAMKGRWSIFSKFPSVYGDLRAAIMPTLITGYNYKFLVEDNFVGPGSMYPLGFPLEIDNVSLSWVSAFVGAQYSMNTATPALTADQIENYGPDTVVDLWTRIIDAKNSMHSWDTAGQENVYMKRIEAFALTNTANDDPENNRWCNFSLEKPFLQGAKWLSYLGLAKKNPLKPRAGSFTIANYQTAANYAHRLVDGIVGIGARDIIIRFKTVDVESIIQANTVSLVAGDLQYNEVAGAKNIDQTLLPRSVVSNMDAGQFLHASLITIMKRFGVMNFVGFDNPVTNSFVLAGAQYATGSTEITNRTWTWMAESFAGLQRLVHNASPTLQFVTMPLIVAYGTFGCQGFSNLNDQTNLLPLMNVMYPDFATVSYSFRNPPISGLTPVVDPDSNLLSFTEGDAIPSAVETYSSQVGALQGNMSTAVSTNRVHGGSTFMLLTRMLSAPEVNYGKKRREKKKVIKELDLENKSFIEVSVTPDSPIYSAKVEEIRSRYDFNVDNVTWCLTRILPSTFVKSSDYCSIYKELVSAPTEAGSVTEYGKVYVKNIIALAHPIAGSGDEQNIGDTTRQEMGLGGGFFNSIGGFLDGILGGI